MQRARAAQELERAVRRREAEPRVGAARALEEVDRGEAAAGGLDRVEDGASLRRQSGPRREFQASVGTLRSGSPSGATLPENDSHFQRCDGTKKEDIARIAHNGRRGSPGLSRARACGRCRVVGRFRLGDPLDDRPDRRPRVRGPGRRSGPARRRDAPRSPRPPTRSASAARSPIPPTARSSTRARSPPARSRRPARRRRSSASADDLDDLDLRRRRHRRERSAPRRKPPRTRSDVGGRLGRLDRDRARHPGPGR